MLNKFNPFDVTASVIPRLPSYAEDAFIKASEKLAKEALQTLMDGALYYGDVDHKTYKEFYSESASSQIQPSHDIKCECGTASVKGSKHSTWCPIKD